MKSLKKIMFLNLTLALSVLSACSQNSGSGFDEKQEGFFTADAVPGVNAEALSPADQDLYHHVGLSMLVEQFEAENLSTMRSAIDSNPPAGIVFWNPKGVGASELGAITRAYSQSAKNSSSKQLPLLFSTDYEGGGLTRTLSGNSVPGIQRFKKGFTLFPHGQWLGREIEKLNTDEICAIQGEAMGKELIAAGINYPLATVSDLAGGLFINRSISTNPLVVARCLNTMMDKFNEGTGGKAVFVTKHFPGLGFTKGDTHEMTVISDRRGAEFDRHILPYRLVLEKRRQQGTEDLMGVMVGHAQFTAFSPTRTSTESGYLLKNILKGTGAFTEQDAGVKNPHTGLGFQGLVLSDAMWMGVYGFVHSMATLGRLEDPSKLPSLKQFLVNEGFFTAEKASALTAADYQRVYNVLSVNTLLAGMDILMVPNVQFAKLVYFFRKGVAGQWDEEEQRLLLKRTGLDGNQAREALKARLGEIIAKNRRVRAKLAYPSAVMAESSPSELDVPLNNRMHQILQALDPAW